MDKITVRRLRWGCGPYRAALALRDGLLRRPLGLSVYDEDIPAERAAWHVGAFAGRHLVGVLVLWPTGDTARMRQVAVEESFQRRGVGRRLVQYAEALLLRRGIRRVVLHARMSAVPFYEKMGYRATGAPFMELGIGHLPMEKCLGPHG